MIKLTMKSGEVINTEESFEVIQRAIANKGVIEINVEGRRKILQGDSIESVDAPSIQVSNSVYKANAALSNFPFQQTPEEIKAMQYKMQPMKQFFDAKKEAMAEMKAKEDSIVNHAYAKKFGGYLNPEETVVIEETKSVEFIPEPVIVAAQTELNTEPLIEGIPAAPTILVKKGGRPKKS